MAAAAKLITVSCAEHHETLVQRFWHFFKTGQRLDFDLTNGGGHPILVHTLVVDAFMSLDNFGPERKAQRESGRDMSASLNGLLEFMYRGTVSVPEEGLQDLLVTAKEFEFKMLVESIESTVAGRTERDRLDLREVASTGATDAVLDEVTDNSEYADSSNGRLIQVRSPAKSQKSAWASTTTKSRVTLPTDDILPTVASGQVSDAVGSMASSAVVKQTEGRFSRRIDSAPKRAIQCEHCRFSTYSEPAFRVHMAKHDSSIALDKCEVCGRKVPSGPQALRSHQCVDRYRFRCSRCPFRTYENARFQLHLASHDPSSAKLVLLCASCNKPFLRRDALEKHEAKKHGATSALSVPALTYSCKLCKYETCKRDNYSHHLFKRHDLDTYGAPLRKDLRCDRCDYRCVRPCELRNHVAAKHSTEKAFKCPLCPYAAALRKDLHVHNLRTHLRIRKYACDMCDLKFHNNFILEQHRRTHTGERPFVCEVCGKAYAELATLRFHARCHEEGAERPVCHICGHLSKRHQYLKAHLINVHKMDAVSAAAAARPRAKEIAAAVEDGTVPST